LENQVLLIIVSSISKLIEKQSENAKLLCSLLRTLRIILENSSKFASLQSNPLDIDSFSSVSIFNNGGPDSLKLLGFLTSKLNPNLAKIVSSSSPSSASTFNSSSELFQNLSNSQQQTYDSIFFHESVKILSKTCNKIPMTTITMEFIPFLIELSQKSISFLLLTDSAHQPTVRKKTYLFIN